MKKELRLTKRVGSSILYIFVICAFALPCALWSSSQNAKLSTKETTASKKLVTPEAANKQSPPPAVKPSWFGQNKAAISWDPSNLQAWKKTAEISATRKLSLPEPGRGIVAFDLKGKSHASVILTSFAPVQQGDTYVLKHEGSYRLNLGLGNESTIQLFKQNADSTNWVPKDNKTLPTSVVNAEKDPIRFWLVYHDGNFQVSKDKPANVIYTYKDDQPLLWASAIHFGGGVTTYVPKAQYLEYSNIVIQPWGLEKDSLYWNSKVGKNPWAVAAARGNLFMFTKPSEGGITFSARTLSQIMIPMHEKNSARGYLIVIGAEKNSSIILLKNDQSDGTKGIAWKEIERKKVPNVITGGFPEKGRKFDQYWVSLVNDQLRVWKGEANSRVLLFESKKLTDNYQVQRFVLGGGASLVEYKKAKLFEVDSGKAAQKIKSTPAVKKEAQKEPKKVGEQLGIKKTPKKLAEKEYRGFFKRRDLERERNEKEDKKEEDKKKEDKEEEKKPEEKAEKERGYTSTTLFDFSEGNVDLELLVKRETLEEQIAVLESANIKKQLEKAVDDGKALVERARQVSDFLTQRSIISPYLGEIKKQANALEESLKADSSSTGGKLSEKTAGIIARLEPLVQAVEVAIKGASVSQQGTEMSAMISQPAQLVDGAVLALKKADDMKVTVTNRAEFQKNLDYVKSLLDKKDAASLAASSTATILKDMYQQTKVLEAQVEIAGQNAPKAVVTPIAPGVIRVSPGVRRPVKSTRGRSSNKARSTRGSTKKSSGSSSRSTASNKNTAKTSSTKKSTTSLAKKKKTAKSTNKNS